MLAINTHIYNHPAVKQFMFDAGMAQARAIGCLTILWCKMMNHQAAPQPNNIGEYIGLVLPREVKKQWVPELNTKVWNALFANGFLLIVDGNKQLKLGYEGELWRWAEEIDDLGCTEETESDCAVQQSIIKDIEEMRH